MSAVGDELPAPLPAPHIEEYPRYAAFYYRGDLNSVLELYNKENGIYRVIGNAIDNPPTFKRKRGRTDYKYQWIITLDKRHYIWRGATFKTWEELIVNSYGIVDLL